jgi:NAD(P)-dependent dehydrogenase (short-subunit alcohol dehydrogenase family)
VEANNHHFQATTMQADAADETAIKTVCEQAIQEEGRLDVFFANVWNPAFGATARLTYFTGRPASLVLPQFRKSHRSNL